MASDRLSPSSVNKLGEKAPLGATWKALTTPQGVVRKSEA